LKRRKNDEDDGGERYDYLTGLGRSGLRRLSRDYRSTKGVFTSPAAKVPPEFLSDLVIPKPFKSPVIEVLEQLPWERGEFRAGADTIPIEVRCK
jgi:hypothetical protein